MSDSSVESQVATFLAKYTPAIEAQLRDARSRLRALFPRGFELVFDNYNALVFGFSPTERSTDAFISVVGYPKWITLFFLHGAGLHDPHGLLEGKGSQVRSIRLKSPAELSSPEVAALISQAVRPHEPVLHAAPALQTIIKTVVAKQRPRRPKAAERKSPRKPGRHDSKE
jgi:hypothetical protein